MTTTIEEKSLEETLALIAQAVEEAKGNPKEEARLLEAIVDPQENLNCEGCQ